MTIHPNMKGRLEALLFVSGDPVSLSELSRALSLPEADLDRLLLEMEAAYAAAGSGFTLRRIAGKVRLATRSEYADDIIRLLRPPQKASLRPSVLETLAVIAYTQPCTRADIEAIRGVKCDYSVHVLLDKGLIAEVGRRDTLGRPALFGTTEAFLSHFGLSSPEDLPPLDPTPDLPEEEPC